MDEMKMKITGRVSQVAEKYVRVEATPGNAQYPYRVTVWCKADPSLREGSQVTVAGDVSWKKDTYTDKNGDVKDAISVSINNPTFADLPAPVTSDLPF